MKIISEQNSLFCPIVQYRTKKTIYIPFSRLFLYLKTTDVSVEQELCLFDLNVFLASIGGSLDCGIYPRLSAVPWNGLPPGQTLSRASSKPMGLRLAGVIRSAVGLTSGQRAVLVCAAKDGSHLTPAPTPVPRLPSPFFSLTLSTT